MHFRFDPIGLIRSPYRDKFGIPRQPGLVEAAEARLRLLPPYDRPEAFAGLEGFSHIWLLFVFHADCLDAGWRPTVRPPRLGGRAKVGVFASRAPYRPNPIGISAVRHQGLIADDDGLALRLTGIDLLDGTPVLDIKPYLPYADRIDAASGGFAAAAPTARLAVVLGPEVESQITAADPDGALRLRELIRQVIAQDPRPGYMDRYPARSRFGLRLYQFDITWELAEGTARVLGVRPIGMATEG